MDFDKAFEILGIEPADDKKAIKTAYSQLLKKYHPEEYPEKFIEINEAYKTALDFRSFENAAENFKFETDFRNIQNFEYSNAYENDYFFQENDFFESGSSFSDDKKEFFSDMLDDNFNIEESKVNHWTASLKRQLLGEIRPLEYYGKLLHYFYYELNELERQEVLKILRKSEMISQAWTFSELERELIAFSLGKEKNETLENIFKNYWNGKEDKATEKFIDKYFNVKLLKFSGRTFGIYTLEGMPDNATLTLKIFENLFGKVTEKFTEISYLISVFHPSLKNSGGLLFTLSTWGLALSFFLFPLTFIFSNIYFGFSLKNLWHMWLAYLLIIGLVEFVNVKAERNFEWSRHFKFLELAVFVTMIICGLIFFLTSEFSVIIQFLIISGIFSVRFKILSDIRYRKLRDTAIQILKTFDTGKEKNGGDSMWEE